VRSLESNIKVFIRTAIIILSAFIVLLIVFSVAYTYASINLYNTILIVFIVAVCVCIFVLVLMCLAIVYSYKKKKASGLFLTLTKLGLRVMLPVALLIAKVNNKTRKSIRYFYIELNNIVVESDNKKYRAEDIMLLLPHCLQNSECGLKVTNNPKLCKRCGKCKIGALMEYAEQKNISIFIATGGTVARNIIKKIKPKLIVSVACERDLMSGISDVQGIPVVGVTNKQPNGPCFNTDVNIDTIQNRVEQLTYDCTNR
jgi:uncharacterized protein